MSAVSISRKRKARAALPVAEVSRVSWSDLTYQELRVLVRARGLLPNSFKKADLIAVLSQ